MKTKMESVILSSSATGHDAYSKDELLSNGDFEFPPDEDISEMIKEVNLKTPLPNVTERYFTTYYRMNFPKEGEDVCIRIHSNRLCMISLAPNHEIFQTDKKIEKIDFQVTEKLNRAKNAVSGKAKHGAQPLHETSKLCTIACTDGAIYIVRCGMTGKLTEANTDLLDNPELLKEQPHKGGYLAIVLPKIEALEKLKNILVTQDVYDATIKNRLSSKFENVSSHVNGAEKRPCEYEAEKSREKMIKIEASQNEKNIVNNEETLTLPCI